MAEDVQNSSGTTDTPRETRYRDTSGGSELAKDE
jgi:hypothetical protein